MYKECASVAAAGYRVSLVVPAAPGEAFPGIHIVPIVKPTTRLARMFGGAARCLREAKRLDADLYQFHDPELIRVGLALRRSGKKVLYDVHESHAESRLDRAYLPVWLRPAMASQVRRAERKADRYLDGIVAATPKIARAFCNPRTVLVQNYPKLGELDSVAGGPFAERERAVVFVGGISEARGCHQMVEAMPKTGGARLLLAGSFSPPALRERLSALPGWSQVETLGQIGRAEVALAMSRARAGIVVFLPLRNHVESQPNKLFEYMAAGLPVIASDFPYWRQIVGEVGCGIHADPNDPDSIAAAVRALVDDPIRAQEMGMLGQQAVRERFHWDTQAPVLLELYAELLGPLVAATTASPRAT
ncbi:MAG: glycosyltransferase family 4 protein [Fimbriimonadaceae bacterium]|nr:glycosyltransferase family 4 protein [Fimbriimonadaceae bacterium]